MSLVHASDSSQPLPYPLPRDLKSSASLLQCRIQSCIVKIPTWSSSRLLYKNTFTKVKVHSQIAIFKAYRASSFKSARKKVEKGGRQLTNNISRFMWSSMKTLLRMSFSSKPLQGHNDSLIRRRFVWNIRL